MSSEKADGRRKCCVDSSLACPFFVRPARIARSFAPPVRHEPPFPVHGKHSQASPCALGAAAPRLRHPCAPSHVARHAEARVVERAGPNAWTCPCRRLLSAPPSPIPPSHVTTALASLLTPPLLPLLPLLPLPAPPRPSLPLPAIPPLVRQEAVKNEKVKMKGVNVPPSLSFHPPFPPSLPSLSPPIPSLHAVGSLQEAAEKYEKVKMKGNVVKRRQWLNLSLRSYRHAFSWVAVALAMPERELIAHAGLDNVVFLHTLKLGCVRPSFLVPPACNTSHTDTALSATHQPFYFLTPPLPVSPNSLPPLARQLQDLWAHPDSGGSGAIRFKIFGPILIVAAAVLMPVNYLGGWLQQQAQSDPDLYYSAVDQLSIANIPNQSPLLWVHVAMAWLFNAWALYMMRLEHRTVADMRLDYLADQQRAPNQFTVLVRQVPKHPIKTVPEHVDHFFSVNHRGHYLLTQPVYNANRVARLEKKRGKLENKLTELHIKLERFPNKPLTVRMGIMGLVGERVDAVQHYQDKLEEICDEIIAERERVISDPARTMPAAFVSFSSRWGAAVAAQTLQSKNSSHWITQWAPEQRDVKWSNLPIPYEQLAVRRVLVLLAAASVVFFYTIPVGFVQSLANLDNISRYMPWLQPILSIPVVNALITDILSGVALKLFMAVLPYLLIFLASLEGHVSLSQIDLAATGKYFWFIIGTVFVTNVMGGALMSATHELSEHTTR
ncbi:unnamed protein product [Closterium sp. Naga37s-1]|nr:unnamed protein product [Closterium sp. Naga37s-1]